MTDELRHRDIAEPLEANVSLAASRASKRLMNMLKTQRSRMSFIRILADLFGLEVEYGEADSVRLTIPAFVDEATVNHTVPNVMRVTKAGAVVPVDYELKEFGTEADYPL